MRDHPPPPSYTTILHLSYNRSLTPPSYTTILHQSYNWPSWQHTIVSNSHIRPAPAFSASIWTCQYSRFQIICTLHKSAAKRLVLVHMQVLALLQAFERQLSNITGYLRLSSLTGQIHPAVKKITKAGVQLSTIWRKEASSQSWQSAVGPQLGIVLAVRRSLQIGPITVRSSLRLPDRPFPARPTQFGDGNRQPGNQRPLNFRIGWQSARRCIRFCTVFLQPMSIEMFYLLLH